MQLTELIDMLEELRMKHGDILVYFFDGVQEFEIEELNYLSTGGFGKRIVVS